MVSRLPAFARKLLLKGRQSRNAAHTEDAAGEASSAFCRGVCKPRDGSQVIVSRYDRHFVKDEYLEQGYAGEHYRVWDASQISPHPLVGGVDGELGAMISVIWGA